MAAPLDIAALEAQIDPEVLAQLRALPLEQGRPLVAVDADECLVYLAAHLARWLPGIGYRLVLTQYQLEGSIFEDGSDVPLPFDECLELIDRFFSGEVLHQQALPGAAPALERLAQSAQVMVLTNVPRHGRDLRRQNLAGLGLGYPMVENSGGKGKALAWIASQVAAPMAFVDDSLRQHESAARRAPEVTRIHFVGATHLKRILPESPAADHRAEDWPACEAMIRRALRLPDLA